MTMEPMDLERYRQKIRRRVIALVVLFSTFTCLAVMLQAYFKVFAPNGTPEQDFLSGFRLGVFFALDAELVFIVILNLITLRSEKRLKKEWIRENDERTKAISGKSSQTTCIAMLILLGVGSVVAGFFNTIVFTTLLIVLLCLITWMVGTTLYYNRKY